MRVSALFHARLPPLSGIFFFGIAPARHPVRFALLTRYLAVFALAACTAQPTGRPPTVNLAGFPPAFKEGYALGCESARTGRVQRDANRYGTDRQYAAGWRDGFDACGPRPATSKRPY